MEGATVQHPGPRARRHPERGPLCTHTDGAAAGSTGVAEHWMWQDVQTPFSALGAPNVRMRPRAPRGGPHGVLVPVQQQIAVPVQALTVESFHAPCEFPWRPVPNQRDDMMTLSESKPTIRLRVVTPTTEPTDPINRLYAVALYVSGPGPPSTAGACTQRDTAEWVPSLIMSALKLQQKYVDDDDEHRPPRKQARNLTHHSVQEDAPSTHRPVHEDAQTTIGLLFGGGLAPIASCKHADE